MKKRTVAILVLWAAVFANLLAGEPPKPEPAFITIVLTDPQSSPAMVSIREGTGRKITCGQLLGPLGLRPGSYTLKVDPAGDDSSWQVALKPGENSVAILHAAPDTGKLLLRRIKLPEVDRRRLVHRLPGTGSAEWLIANEPIAILASPVEVKSQVTVKDEKGEKIIEFDSSEAGHYFLASKGDPNIYTVLFIP